MSLALASARRSTNRGSAQDGEPSGMRMSQNIRAESPAPFFHGSTWNVPGSGLAIMSLSEARAKPSIAEPSKPMPSAKAPSSSAGATATDLRKPSTSVNHSRTKRISRSSSVRSTNSSCRSMNAYPHRYRGQSRGRRGHQYPAIRPRSPPVCRARVSCGLHDPPPVASAARQGNVREAEEMAGVEYRFRPPTRRPEDNGAPAPRYRQGTADGMIIERDVAVPVRGGVTVYADVFRPADERPAPPLI